MICSRLSEAMDWRIRLMSAVCRFKDESSLAFSVFAINLVICIPTEESTFDDSRRIELSELHALDVASFLVIYPDALNTN